MIHLIHLDPYARLMVMYAAAMKFVASCRSCRWPRRVYTFFIAYHVADSGIQYPGIYIRMCRGPSPEQCLLPFAAYRGLKVPSSSWLPHFGHQSWAGRISVEKCASYGRLDENLIS